MSDNVTRSTSVREWLGLIRFSHTIFALPFAALATVMALSTPLPSGAYPVVRLRELIGILLCMVFARSAAMAFNRLVDAKIDALNPRTAGRHIPAGVLSRSSVWAFTLLCCVGFIGSTLLFLPNWIPVIASIPVLLFLCGYSLAKRFTFAAHLWLGIALSLSPICVWLAIRGNQAILSPIDLLAPLVLAAAVAAWVTGFDIIYACQDADYDTSVGLHSVPARFGVAGALRIAAASHLVMIGLLALLPIAARDSGIGVLFWAFLVMIAGLILWQHALVSADDLDRVNEAFFNTNAAISVILLAIGTIDCLWI